MRIFEEKRKYAIGIIGKQVYPDAESGRIRPLIPA
jgi:hypothetical protein